MRGDCQIGIYTVINVATRMIGTLFLRLRIFADCVTNVRHVFASKYPIIEKNVQLFALHLVVYLLLEPFFGHQNVDSIDFDTFLTANVSDFGVIPVQNHR